MSTQQQTVAGCPSAGCFALPFIDPAIPVELDQGHKRGIALARFATAAKAVGVKLPTGDFSSPDLVVQAQWAQHVKRQFPPMSFRTLVGDPAITVTNDKLELAIGSVSRLTAFRMKPVVESLEQSLSGLGWFVSGQIDRAPAFGHEIYGMGFVGYMLDGLFWEMDDFTDESYARAMLMQEGSEPPKGPIDEPTMERLRGDYSHWPSDVLAEVDGHSHLLGLSLAAKERCRTVRPAAARRWVATNPEHPYCEVVRLALQLDRAFSSGDQSFVWSIGDDDTEPLGALCFVAWDSPDMLFEAAGHHEESRYNGGSCVEEFARRTLAINENTSDAEFRELARSAKNYINRWALLEKLLSLFPTWDEDDER